ncbi:hypothetical protein [Cellulosimicrobium sp. Marseille-Q8652]
MKQRATTASKGFRSRLKKVAIATALVGAVTIPTSAQAYSVLYSYSGLDYTRNNTSANSLATHDGECDDRQVSANWYPWGSTNWVGKVNGSGCGTTVNIGTNGRHYGHRVVELNPGGANDYGPWKYPA